MNIESAWISFWKVVLTVGFGSFALLVVAVIPLGAMDIVKLFRRMDREEIGSDSQVESVRKPKSAG